MPRSTRLQVNGTTRVVPAEPTRPLLGVLRDELQLTGAKYGCGEGQCGACTVLLDGRAVRACVTPLASVGVRTLTTIEGIAGKDRLHPLQTAFIDSGAMQCGYCVPGMIMAALGLLARLPQPSEDDIRRGLQGNLCRCGTYPRVVRAVQAAAAVLIKDKP